MKLNKIWGYGQLFGYSAFDGINRYEKDNILMTMKDKLSFRFEYQPYYILMSFKGFKEINFEAVMSDFIIAKTDDYEFLMTFIDYETLIIKSSVLPSFIGENNYSHEILPDGEIIKTSGHFLRYSYQKKDDYYLIIVRHSLTLKNIELPQNEDIDIHHIIDEKIAYYQNMPQCLDLKYEELYYKTLSVNKVNTHSKEGRIKDFWTTPDRVPHRHMWMWDSAFHAMAFVEYNEDAAKKALLSMLKQVRFDGFMPHMVTTKKTSNVTQPCVMSYATLYVYQKTNDLNFLKQCVPYLEKYLTYDIKRRDHNHNGLLEWLTDPKNKKCKCAECGLDNSPRFDFDEEMDAIDFSSYLALDASSLSKIYSLLGEQTKAQKWQNVYERVASQINSLMWDEETGAYYDRLFSGQLTKVLTPTSFLPMFARVSSKEQAEKMVKTLTDPKLLWSKFPVCTISQQDPRFSNDMWRGGVWLNLNYFIIEGLRNYGYDKLAKQLRDITLENVNKWYQKTGCVFEFFDPTGEICPLMCARKGPALPEPDYRKHMHSITDFNWSACFTMLLIQGKF